MKQRSVGLVVRTVVDGVDFCILQRRGSFNTEKMKPESYPYGCQVTCHGAVEDGEDFYSALRRELQEELGRAAQEWLTSVSFITLSHHETEEKEVMTFGVKVDEAKSLLQRITLGPSSGGILLLKQGEEILDLRSYSKTEGVTDTHVIAMFPDEKESVRKAFELL